LYPVIYVEPLVGNEEAVGFDLTSESDRRAAVDAAIATGDITATGPLNLVQDHSKEAGILIIYAVSQGATGPGVVVVVLRMGTFTEKLLS